MSKVVRFMRPFAITVAPKSPILFLSVLDDCLLICKVVRLMRRFAIAVAPESPISLNTK
jgi:hypothetical protein